MPTLDWIGKKKIVNHHLEVPFHVLERKYSYDENGQHGEDNGSENMIIHGDNLLALKSLLPQYEKQIDCIYIDPPYNTGEEKWIYNDNVNDPTIIKWLGEVVGKEGDDLTRHDKWLCMIYPRLRLLQRLISEDGCIIISIGYHEINSLILICKEIFTDRQVVPITLKTSGGKPNGGFNYTQEYAVFIVPTNFEPNPSFAAMNAYGSPYHGMNLATFTQVERPNQTYPIFVDKNGIIKGVGKSLQERIDDGDYCGNLKDFSFDYSEAPSGCVAIWPVTDKGDQCVWRLVSNSLMEDWGNGFIKVVPKNNSKNKNSFTIQYLSEGIKEKIRNKEFEIYRVSDNPLVPTIEVKNYMTAGVNIPLIWTEKDNYTAKGGDEMRDIFGSKTAFTYPKPVKLIERILSYVTDKNSIVLDSFAGSGTTGHAVLNLNNLDGGNRKFILVEMGEYAETITAERLKRVINGYSKSIEEELYKKKLTISDVNGDSSSYDTALEIKENNVDLYEKIVGPKIEDGALVVRAICKEKKEVPGTGGGFVFYELGNQLIKNGHINDEVDLDRVREFIYFSETKQPLEKRREDEPFYLGTHFSCVYYLCYDRDTITTLNRELMGTIKTKGDAYVIYADLCTLSDEELDKYHITFKKIPRDITRL